MAPLLGARSPARLWEPASDFKATRAPSLPPSPSHEARAMLVCRGTHDRDVSELLLLDRILDRMWLPILCLEIWLGGCLQILFLLMGCS